MKIDELKTWDDLQDYLIERMDYATDEQSSANKSFSKEEWWNHLIRQCFKWSGRELPIRTKSILIKSVKKDFGMSI